MNVYDSIMVYNTSTMNFVDLIIILILIFYTIEGFSSGFTDSILDLFAFVISFSVGLAFYSFFGKLLTSFFSIPVGFSSAMGFFLAAFLSEIFSSFLLRTFIPRSGILRRAKKLSAYLDSFLGGFSSLLAGLLLVSFLLTMAISLPLSPFIKKSVSSSKISKILTANTQGLAKTINSVFGGAVNEALTFLTVEPKGNESVPLNFKTEDIRVDEAAEKEMLADVNKERKSRGIRTLELGSQTLVNVARAHCEDMFGRGYFSHNTPEGLSPFDRMTNAGVSFTFAGENLALAPNTTLAMQGFMQSPGHKENILQANFGHVGIGVIDGGIYGEMFCQEFTD